VGRHHNGTPERPELVAGLQLDEGGGGREFEADGDADIPAVARGGGGRGQDRGMSPSGITATRGWNSAPDPWPTTGGGA
jgi:hypothetical protein